MGTSERVDDLLDVLDIGLQQQGEWGLVDVGTQGECWRCLKPIEPNPGGVCDGCRALLLDEDVTDASLEAHCDEVWQRTSYVPRARSMRPLVRRRHAIGGGSWDRVEVGDERGAIIYGRLAVTVEIRFDASLYAAMQEMASRAVHLSRLFGAVEGYAAYTISSLWPPSPAPKVIQTPAALPDRPVEEWSKSTVWKPQDDVVTALYLDVDQRAATAAAFEIVAPPPDLRTSCRQHGPITSLSGGCRSCALQR